MSKKAAESLDVLVLDVKFGRGAFCQSEAEARELARSMVLFVCFVLMLISQSTQHNTSSESRTSDILVPSLTLNHWNTAHLVWYYIDLY